MSCQLIAINFIKIISDLCIKSGSWLHKYAESHHVTSEVPQIFNTKGQKSKLTKKKIIKSLNNNIWHLNDFFKQIHLDCFLNLKAKIIKLKLKKYINRFEQMLQWHVLPPIFPHLLWYGTVKLIY